MPRYGSGLYLPYLSALLRNSSEAFLSKKLSPDKDYEAYTTFLENLCLADSPKLHITPDAYWAVVKPVIEGLYEEDPNCYPIRMARSGLVALKEISEAHTAKLVESERSLRY